jgi:hypothetical protein
MEYNTMKIYVENYSIDLLRSKLNKYQITKTFVKRQFYSEEGIFVVDANNIYKLEITDVPIIREEVDGFVLLKDTSSINKVIVHQLPFDATEIHFNYTQYNGSLIVEKVNDRTTDFYFTSIDNELLSLLN